MTEKNITVKIASGMEARPVALFVQVASQFQSSVYVKIDEKKVNAKSIMWMMSLGVLQDEDLTLIVDGPDEGEAIEKLAEYLTTES
jgi:phosphotransferase system HPr (HPr) family protein